MPWVLWVFRDEGLGIKALGLGLWVWLQGLVAGLGIRALGLVAGFL